MIVVDSSVWIGYLRRDDNAATLQLRHLIKSQVPLGILPAMVREILQGTRDQRQFRRIERLFDALIPATVADPFATARRAAQLYRECRIAGFTVRSPVDCLIAASCIEVEAPLLQRDRNFAALATVRPALKRV